MPSKSLPQIAREIHDLATRARAVLVAEQRFVELVLVIAAFFDAAGEFFRLLAAVEARWRAAGVERGHLERIVEAELSGDADPEGAISRGAGTP